MPSVLQHGPLFGIIFLGAALAACPGRPPSSVDAGSVIELADGGADVEPEPEPELPEDEQLYIQYCSHCHATDGSGYTADNANALANPYFLSVATDDFLADAVRYGRPGTPMSAWGVDFGGPLTDEVIDTLVAFMRKWETDEPQEVHDEMVQGDVTAGEELYEAHCISCHGVDGKGETAVSLTNPWFLKTASDGFLRYAIEAGRPPTTMAAYGEDFGGSLSSENIFDLVAYLRSFEVPIEPEPLPTFEPDLTDILINPEGTEAQFSRTEDRFVAADDVYQAMENGDRFILLDARPASDYLSSHIAGAVSLPFYEAPDALDHLPTDEYIITYCGCPHALSGELFDFLQGAGYTKLGVLDEGYYYWQDQNYPIARGRERYEDDTE